MSVHCIQIQCDSVGNSPPNQTTQTIDNWVGHYTEVLPEQRHQASAVDELTDSTGDVVVPAHITGLYRFTSSEDRTAALDDLEAELGSIGAISWALLTPHTCYHDVDSPRGCSVDKSKQRVIGEPPEELM